VDGLRRVTHRRRHECRRTFRTRLRLCEEGEEERIALVIAEPSLRLAAVRTPKRTYYAKRYLTVQYFVPVTIGDMAKGAAHVEGKCSNGLEDDRPAR
jgi:hypothetical protein